MSLVGFSFVSTTPFNSLKGLHFNYKFAVQTKNKCTDTRQSKEQLLNYFKHKTYNV